MKHQKMATKWRLVTALVLSSIIWGCESKVTDHKAVRREWPQKCDMCGATYTVTPVRNPDEKIPPTVAWCFNDGAYCDVGLGMMIDAHKNGETPERERQWLNHCLACKGCRCAAFDPDEWRKVTDVIKSVRSFETKSEAELQKLADHQESEVIGLAGVADETSKRKDAEAAKKELKRRKQSGSKGTE